jgi:hypothetical protein
VRVYELRVDGRPVTVCADAAVALSRVREVARLDADVEIEVMDLRTGRACAVAAPAEWREEIAARMR